MVSLARKECNSILKDWCKNIQGNVLSIGSSYDIDKEGKKYRDYFYNATKYTTSEVSSKFGCDLILDVTNMSEILNETYDCVFCIGVLEHVFECRKGLEEITRILKRGGTLIVGFPFNQRLHCEPTDFWRFTKFTIDLLLRDNFIIKDIKEVGPDPRFPISILTLAYKKE